MKKPMAAVRPNAPSLREKVLASGATAVLLAVLASMAGAVSLYLR